MTLEPDANCFQSLLDGVQHRRLQGLPFANVCTAVHVQHFSRDLTSFDQVNDRVHDVLDFGNPPTCHVAVKAKNYVFHPYETR